MKWHRYEKVEHHLRKKAQVQRVQRAISITCDLSLLTQRILYSSVECKKQNEQTRIRPIDTENKLSAARGKVFKVWAKWVKGSGGHREGAIKVKTTIFIGKEVHSANNIRVASRELFWGVT